MTKRQLFWVSLLLFAVHQLLQKGFGIHLLFFHAYLDPFLAMPILLGIFEWERNWRYGAPPLRVWEVAVVTISFSVLFEWGFPRWSSRFTADWYDVLAYGLGSAVYVWAGERSNLPVNRKNG
jgi:surface polysaccharide O-acyltransferase-like enzyme